MDTAEPAGESELAGEPENLGEASGGVTRYRTPEERRRRICVQCGGCLSLLGLVLVFWIMSCATLAQERQSLVAPTPALRLLVFDNDVGKGALDRAEVIWRLLPLAHALGAQLVLAPPCQLLAAKFTGGELVDCTVGWEAYFEVLDSSGHNHSLMRPPKDELLPPCERPPCIRLRNGSEHVAWLEDGAPMRDHYAAAAALPPHVGFTWLLPDLDLRGGPNSVFFNLPPLPAVPLRIRPAAPLRHAAEQLLAQLGINDTIYTLHVRRGDVLRSARASGHAERACILPPHETAEYVACSLRGAAPAPLLLFSDDESPGYVSDVLRRLEKLEPVSRALHADPRLAALLPRDEIGVYLAGLALQQRATRGLEQRRNLHCTACDPPGSVYMRRVYGEAEAESWLGWPLCAEGNDCTSRGFDEPLQWHEQRA